MSGKQNRARRRRIPSPPHPEERRAPLPGDRPKSEVEDPSARAKVQAILDSPAYRDASADMEFLAGEETREARLELDYLEAELQLRKHGVTDTIVVFGSAGLVEPQNRAAARLEEARRALAARPAKAALAEAVAIAEKIAEKSRYYDIAREFGALVGAARRWRMAAAWRSSPAAARESLRPRTAARSTLAADGVGFDARCRANNFPTPM